jgi:alkanesulfonate monooxygenase SsuD/methylene tetrahydromethanopterin reductase-like flavin-dependent oxidoreductase (luciferase family)
MGSVGGRPLKVGLFLTAFDQPWANAPAPRWNELVARAKRAEEIGVDSLWVPDHLLVRDADEGPLGVWEGWSLLAALAASTERVELGPLVACTAFRNPALLAKMADTVDEISGGRLTLGLGAGWHEPEFQAFGYPFDHRVSRFEEAVTIIHGLLKHGQIDFEGMYYQARDCELRPRGPRAAGPPIMIGASGARVLRLTARFADVWNRDFDKVNPELEPFSPEDLTAWRPRVDAACVKVGRDPATLERTAAVLVDLPIAPGREGWNALTGSPEELASGLRNYASAGFSHVQIWLEPSTIAGIEAFAPVLELLDGG